MAFEDLKKKIKKQFESKKQEEKKEEPKTFDYLSVEELLKVLGLTIKSDQENKLATFLCQLSAYTEKSQFNISFNAPSSTGKSYIPIETAKLFPKEDVIEIGYCSPTAFFHDNLKKEKDGERFLKDLERKILVFLDQPHNQLLQNLRPILSHDKKEILIKITDRSKRKLRTKNVVVRGFPSVIFCSAGLNISEQEATRFLLLSPEISQEKIREAVLERLEKESDYQTYQKKLDNNLERIELMERIKAIKETKIENIKISEELRKIIKERFFAKHKFLKPRHSRDIKRLISLTKAFCLLNLWNREMTEDKVLMCKKEDFENALGIWKAISKSQELNLPPYVFQLFEKVVLPLWTKGTEGITRQAICTKHLEVYGIPLPTWKLRKEILPMWENAGLMIQEADMLDKRKMLVKPIQEKIDSKNTE